MISTSYLINEDENVQLPLVIEQVNFVVVKEPEITLTDELLL